MNVVSQTVQSEVDDRDRSKLRWRARRGLVENDIILQRFFEKHLHELTQADIWALFMLLDLSDNDLLDLFLQRRQLSEVLDISTVSMDLQHRLIAILEKIRR